MDKNINDKEYVKVENIEYPKEGGVLTYLKGFKFPFPGFPAQPFVHKTALIKALIPALCKGAKYVISSDNIDPKKYSRPVREIYRLFNLLIEKEKREEMKQKWVNLRDVICYILEFDSAYRFRLQDVLREINLKEIEPDEYTKYYMSLKDDFNFKCLEDIELNNKEDNIKNSKKCQRKK
jgi:hypothetical protein